MGTLNEDGASILCSDSLSYTVNVLKWKWWLYMLTCFHLSILFSAFVLFSQKWPLLRGSCHGRVAIHVHTISCCKFMVHVWETTSYLWMPLLTLALAIWQLSALSQPIILAYLQYCKSNLQVDILLPSFFLWSSLDLAEVGHGLFIVQGDSILLGNPTYTQDLKHTWDILGWSWWIINHDLFCLS